MLRHETTHKYIISKLEYENVKSCLHVSLNINLHVNNDRLISHQGPLC